MGLCVGSVGWCDDIFSLLAGWLVCWVLWLNGWCVGSFGWLALWVLWLIDFLVGRLVGRCVGFFGW